MSLWLLLLIACDDNKDSPDPPGLSDTGVATSDTGCATPGSWYSDVDEDGFGDPATGVEACLAPSGTVEDGSDCDDGDDGIHPDADEVCNGVDDDCDTLVDDADDDVVDASTWYADLDGDGYGDPDAPFVACGQPTLTSSLDTDCDDDDGSVNPAGTELWYDELDSDCDGDDDPDPCLDPPGEGTVEIDETCTYTPEVGSFNPVVEWQVATYTDEPDAYHVISAPMVGQLSDDDGDGDIVDDDTPDVVVVAFNRISGSSGGVLRVLSGDSGAEVMSAWDLDHAGDTWSFYRYSTVALGDIDGDGETEIVGTLYNGSCYAGAISADGVVEWVATAVSVSCRAHAPALHDLDGDGLVEVVYGRQVLNGADGTLRGEGTGGAGYYSGYSNSGFHSFGADLDGDGTLEVIAGSDVYDADGATVCSTGYTDGYPAAGDLDGDGDGEFVVSGNGDVRTFEHDCTLRHSWDQAGGGHGGPPTLADFDGDGDPEIGVAGGDYYVVYEADGTELWSQKTNDHSSNSTGSSVFDFDGDGQAEVVYADETTLWVYDGATGTVLLEDTTHNSGTVNEYPTVADVDGDGKAEIVVPDDNASLSVTVIGDADDDWVSARTLWNQHAYHITHVDDDLAIPAAPAANWPTYNNFRQGAPGHFDPLAASNLLPVVHGTCQADCGEDVDVLVQVANDGQIPAGADLVLAIYGEAKDGSWVWLDAVPFGDAVGEGALTAAYSLSFPVATLTPYTTLWAVVDDEEAANECEEGDNAEAIDLSDVCP